MRTPSADVEQRPVVLDFFYSKGKGRLVFFSSAADIVSALRKNATLEGEVAHFLLPVTL